MSCACAQSFFMEAGFGTEANGMGGSAFAQPQVQRSQQPAPQASPQAFEASGFGDRDGGSLI